MAAMLGVPLYACGGGTIPLLQQWLHDGMSMVVNMVIYVGLAEKNIFIS